MDWYAFVMQKGMDSRYIQRERFSRTIGDRSR